MNPTTEDARTLVLDLCEIAGDQQAVSERLIALARGSATREVAAIALTALHTVFTECLSAPVPVSREAA